MALFSFGNRTLGIDFGTSAIKAVEFSAHGGKISLENYGEAELLSPERRSNMPTRSFKDDINLRFRALLERLSPKTDAISVSMPAYLGLISLIEFPEMTDEELAEAAKFEAKKYVPSTLEEVSLSWEKLGVRPDTTEDGRNHPVRTEVLLVAALNKDVWQYENYVKTAGYKMRLLELETFSVARAVVGRDPGVFLVIDIGARASNLILVEDGYIKMSRNLDMGGIDITQTLSQGLNITLDRAEALKKSGKDFLNSPESAMIFPGIDMLVSEAKRMIGAWRSKGVDRRIDSVLLSGGSARFTGFTGFLSSRLDVPVVLANPWKSVTAPEKLRPFIEEMGTSYSTAIGLALYGLQPK